MIRPFAFAFLVAVAYLLWRRPSLLRNKWAQQWLVPTLAASVAVLYAASPVDLIPDVTPIGALDDIVVLITAFMWARQRLRAPEAKGQRSSQGPARTETREPWDPYAVLGIGHNASADEITHAYRAQLKRYHPDRVAGLGEELQRVAHEKTLEITRAYRELS
jgi:uncharacterized membrane protein YkvA (DUF1232 family)